MKHKLHPGAKWLFRIRIYYIFLFIFLFMFIFLRLSPIWNFLIFIVLILILFVVIFTEIYVRMAYNRWFYEFTPTDLKLERGVIWKKYSNIPYERVQNVDVHRGVIARVLRFSTVMIHTAGYSYYPGKQGLGAEGNLPAVDMEEAERIRELLIKKISKRYGQGI